MSPRSSGDSPDYRKHSLKDLAMILQKQSEAYEKAGDLKEFARVQTQIIETLVDTR